MAKAKKRTPKKIVNHKLVEVEPEDDDFEEIEEESEDTLAEIAQFDEIGGEEDEEELYLSEDAEELLAEITDEKIEEIGVPTLLRHPAPQSEDYPTENHQYTRTKHRSGDIAPAFNQTLIIRADPPKPESGDRRGRRR
jgi:hypothetical protein